jgi:hypothetical protein
MSRATIGLGLWALVHVAGCGQPSPEQLVGLASELLLQPERTCSQLRVDFGLEFLPVVETPAEVGIPYEEHFVETPDGEVLRVWYFPSAAGKGVVILSNGMVGEIPCYLFLTVLLYENGWDVVMYDYRGFGGSSGLPTIALLTPDLDAIVDWTLARTGFAHVTLYGQSLGSIPSVALAVDRPDVVNAVVLDSPAAPGLLLSGLYTQGVLLAPALAAVAPPDFFTEDVITRVRQPVLVYLHEKDELLPPETVRAIYDRAGGPKRLVYFGGLGHYRGIFFQTEAYVYALEDFLLEVWTGSGLPDLVPDLIDYYRNLGVAVSTTSQ